MLLVAEDDLTADRLDAVLMRPEGTAFEITRVLQVEEALFKLRDTAFDAMLIDISVHEADGLDSLMRARAAASSVPIVVLTYQRDEATEEATAMTTAAVRVRLRLEGETATKQTSCRICPENRS